jgi:hypothetical protein
MSYQWHNSSPGMGNQFLGGNAFNQAFANSTNQMNNIGNLVGGAFQQTNQMNQENAQFNAREQGRQQRFDQIMPLIQAMMGNMSGGGAAPSRGFQATNSSQGGSLNY